VLAAGGEALLDVLQPERVAGLLAEYVIDVLDRRSLPQGCVDESLRGDAELLRSVEGAGILEVLRCLS
jgi:hypothetical protein